MSVVHRPVLYGYYRSSCTWRVRTALNWKNINYDTHVVNLQSKDYLNNTEFLSVSPNKKVPVLVHNGNSISESLAIIEYLDEQFPSCPFLPKDPVKRAQARAIALQITAGIQPLQNKRVVNYVQEQQKTGAELQEAAGGGPLTFVVPAFDPEKNERIRQTWCKYWVNDGLVDLEAMVQRTAGIYAVGNEVTTADFCIPSIMDKARGYKVDMSKFPILNRIDEELAKLEPFQRAEARNQPDSQQ